jgi:hypothetical protein
MWNVQMRGHCRALCVGRVAQVFQPDDREQGSARAHGYSALATGQPTRTQPWRTR